MHWARPPVFLLFPGFLRYLLHLFYVCRDRRDNKFNELQPKTVEKLAATWRPLGNPNYFFPFTIRTAARVGDHMADLSQIWWGTMDSVAFFVCVHRWDKLCRSSLSPTRSDKLSLNCKIGGIWLYNRKRISQQQRTFSVANNNNWVSSSTSRMRTMGCPGAVSGQLTGCGVHTPSIFLSFFFFSFSPLFRAFSLLKVLLGTQFVLCCYDTKNAYVVLASAYRGRQFNKWPILLLRLISSQHTQTHTHTQTDKHTVNVLL